MYIVNHVIAQRHLVSYKEKQEEYQDKETERKSIPEFGSINCKASAAQCDLQNNMLARKSAMT